MSISPWYWHSFQEWNFKAVSLLPKPLFQSEAKCKAIDKKLFFFIPLQTDFFFKEGLASSLKWELFWTRKWPIEDFLICTILEDKQIVLGESENG